VSADANPTPIFLLHVMKTAGTSVTRALRSRYPDAEIYPAPTSGEATYTEKTQIASLVSIMETSSVPALVSVHMPGWVADRASDSHLCVTVLRDPVERTISHLRHIARNHDGSTLDELYDDPIYRALLPNYQTRVFAATEAYYEQREQDIADAFTRALNGEPSPPGMPVRHADVEQAASRLAIAHTQPLVAGSLNRAQARLAKYDLVGITEQLDRFADAIEERTGVALDLADRANRAKDGYAVSASLRKEIEADNTLDLELHASV
jgi:hypothetical protein